MKKFVIVDHSLCNLQGHHYECSLSMAETAARAGFQPLILAKIAGVSHSSRNAPDIGNGALRLLDYLNPWEKHC
jgi:hypothetical protein